MSFDVRHGESGNARLKFMLVMAIIAGLAYVGYRTIPIAYQAYLFKDFMQHNVDVAATQGHPANWVQEQLTKSLPEYSIPRDAVITPSRNDQRMQVRVQYTIPIEFPGYTYNYQFDHEAKSTTFFVVK